MKVLVDWNLWDNPKLFRLAELLKRNSPEAAGYLVRLWSVTAEFRASGSLEDMSTSEIAQACRWRGSATKFVSALRKSGWVDGAQVHEWQEHQGKFIEKIISERARKKRAYEARSLRGESVESPREKATPVSLSVSGSVSKGDAPPENGEDSRADWLPSSPLGMLLEEARRQKLRATGYRQLKAQIEGWHAQKGFPFVQELLMGGKVKGWDVLDISRQHFSISGKQITDELFKERRDASGPQKI